jgi:hypothetical protein
VFGKKALGFATIAAPGRGIHNQFHFSSIA